MLMFLHYFHAFIATGYHFIGFSLNIFIAAIERQASADAIFIRHFLRHH